MGPVERAFAVDEEVRGHGPERVEAVGGELSVPGPNERVDDARIGGDLLPALRNRVNVVEVKYTYE